MGNLNSTERQFLETQFGERVNFDRTERRLYGHDIASLPGVAQLVVGDTTPDAVVQPESEDQLAELVRWAAEHSIPLTPRGKASSGYGGTLPVKKGLVVDFHRMNRVLDIDAKALTVTVQAGIVWEKVDAALERQGLALKLYPSSYPGSTVGGWLAQGGAGIGSYETGWFSQNVVSARVVLADGSVKEFKGPELSLISDAEGTTGFISQLTNHGVHQPADVPSQGGRGPGYHSSGFSHCGQATRVPGKSHQDRHPCLVSPVHKSPNGRNEKQGTAEAAPRACG